jgi:Cu(I)/Ag(I) efflux system membrane fusion protein
MLLITAAACHREGAHGAADRAGELSPAIVEPYLLADGALAEDRVEGLAANAAAIGAAARALGPGAASIDTAAARLASAADLGSARASFGELSDAIDSYMSREHLAPPAGVRKAFCPMVMRSWLQKSGELRNPYYGSQMLTCGSFQN